MLLRFFVLAFTVTVLAACSSGPSGRAPTAKPPRDGELPKGDQGGTDKVGQPYKVAGRWYYPKPEPNYDVVGLASWYGKQFHGKRTANGETFNMNALTAAHKTLPMPSFVKVTNLTNGRSLVLRVNDRGPFVDDRIIDVSRRAAQLLGFESKGVTNVRVQISDEKGRVQRREIAGGGERHFVQLGAFASRDNARAQRKRARNSGVEADLQRVQTERQSFWRVRVGPFSSLDKAGVLLNQLRERGFYQARIFSEAAR